MATYMIPVIAKEELQKKLERISKKANAYGNRFEYSFGAETVVTRNVYSVDPVTQTQTKTGEQKVFCVELTIESDIIRKDGYTVIAQIEAIESGKNIVKMIDEKSQPETAWHTMPLYCDHCGTRRVKRFSFIVKDESGQYKQVGKTCLKDYCGIDPKMIAASQEIGDLILSDYGIEEYDFGGCGEYAYDVLKAIATANDIIKENGYVKSDEPYSTKSKLISKSGRLYEASEESMKLAKQMQDELSKADYSELTNYLGNVKNLIESKYCRLNAFGYLAYAPVAFEKMMKQKQQDQQNDEAKANSDYVGTVGDKITADVKESRLITSWQTVYGWTHLYKFTTADGNTLVWYASRVYQGEPKHITGTVKDHKEYDGEKQTVLTRCKLS